MPCLRQKSEMVSPLARSRSASRSNRATSSAFLRLLMGPSRTYSTQRLPFRLDQFSGSTPPCSADDGRVVGLKGRVLEVDAVLLPLRLVGHELVVLIVFAADQAGVARHDAAIGTEGE